MQMLTREPGHSMSHAILTVNGRTLLNDNLSDWQQQPPEAIKQLLNPKTTPTAWAKPAMIALADAALLNQAIRIDITTYPGGGWTLTAGPHLT